MAKEYLGKLDRSPTHLLHRAGQCAYEIFQFEVKGGDVTPRQIAVLMMVESHEGLSQTRLVELTGIDRSTLADIVRRLQRKGLLHRRRTREDARAYAVKLAEEGRQLLKSAAPISDRVDERILEALPQANREKFLDDLTTIVESLQRLSPDSPAPSE